jgi:hypothetical protein
MICKSVRLNIPYTNHSEKKEHAVIMKSPIQYLNEVKKMETSFTPQIRL